MSQPNPQVLKKCTKCGRELATTEFRKQAATRDGLQKQCKTCGSLAEAARYLKKRDHLLALSNAYNKKHRAHKTPDSEA